MDDVKEKVTPIESENKEILENVKRATELKEFIRFCATPRELRIIKTQRDFARKFGLSEDTLTDWKRLPNFWDEVRREIMARERDELSGVISGLRHEAQDGNPAAVKLWLRYIGEWEPESKEVDK